MLIEWMIVASSLCLLLGCMFCIRAYCSLQLQRLDDAREDAWTQAMNGCDPGSPNLAEIGESLKAGQGPPLVKQMVPSSRDAARDFTLNHEGLPNGLTPLTGHREVKFICNPFPGKAVPTSNIVDWLKEWF